MTFAEWIERAVDEDDPRGDFIRDTRDVIDRMRDVTSLEGLKLRMREVSRFTACAEAFAEAERCWHEFEASVG